MSRLSDIAIALIRDAMAAAGHGEKGQVVADLMARFGVCQATIYRHAKRNGTPRKREPDKPEYRDWVEKAVHLANLPPRPAPLDLAISAGIAGGSLPPAAADMPLGTAHRIKRELGLSATPRRTQPMNADYPMQALQIDGSSSDSLIVVKALGDDDWLLKLHRAPTPAGGYKNKPLAEHRQRLVPYGIWDMCTGCVDVHYTVSKGENAHDAMAALVTMLSGDDSRYLRGVPDNLWSDQGALVKHHATHNLLGRLGIAVITGEAYRKERMGGIERQWRTTWERFEHSLFYSKKFRAGKNEFTLSEIRARLVKYLAQENAKRMSRTPVAGREVSRAAAWHALMNRRPEPLRHLPANALATLYREDIRVIDRSGIIRWDGAKYECPDWHNREVLVRQALTEAETLTLEDPVTGERSTARPLIRRAYGEVRGIAATALDKLLEQDAPASGDPYADKQDSPANVMPMARELQAAEALDNPLDADSYADMNAAMAAFTSLYPYPLNPVDRAAVEQRITAAALDRAAVNDLANMLLAHLSPNHLEDAK